MAAVKLMCEGFKPDRDIIFFFSGDEETQGRGATLGAMKWRNLTDAEFGLNADGGCACYDAQFEPLGCGISIAEKTFQTYFLTTRNPGGHSSRRARTTRSTTLPTRSRSSAPTASSRCSNPGQPRLFRGARPPGRE